MGLYRGIRAFTDFAAAVSDKGVSSRGSWATHVPSYTDRPNSGKAYRLNTSLWKRSFPTARLCPQCSAPARAIAPRRVLPISDPGHLMVYQVLSVLWYYSEPA